MACAVRFPKKERWVVVEMEVVVVVAMLMVIWSPEVS